MFKLPDKIKHHIGNQHPIKDTIGESPSKVYLYGNRVLKISKRTLESEREHQALKLLKGFIPVPEVICYVETLKYSYLLMERILGKPLFQYPLEVAIKQSCIGLKALWDIKINDPILSDSQIALDVVRKNVMESGELLIQNADESTFKDEFKTPEDLLDYLIEHYPKDEPTVLSHGDYYLPNILFDGKNITGMIDFGYIGLFPKERDISALIKSLGYNYGDNPTYVSMIEAELGFKINLDLVRYFKLYDELI